MALLSIRGIVVFIRYSLDSNRPFGKAVIAHPQPGRFPSDLSTYDCLSLRVYPSLKGRDGCLVPPAVNKVCDGHRGIPELVKVDPVSGMTMVKGECPDPPRKFLLIATEDPFAN